MRRLFAGTSLCGWRVRGSRLLLCLGGVLGRISCRLRGFEAVWLLMGSLV